MTIPNGIRTGLRPGDLGAVARLHGVVHARDRGGGPAIEGRVAAPLAAFALAPSPRQRIWLAEAGADLVGCVAIVPADAGPDHARLRWFLVHPDARGRGLGRRLLAEAVEFARAAGYAGVTLWTEGETTVADRVYRAAGFRKVVDREASSGGVAVVGERYELTWAGL